MKKWKKVLIIVGAVLVTLGLLFYFLIVRPLQQYHDNNTWSTLMVMNVQSASGKVEGYTADYKKGDVIEVSDIKLVAKHAEHDGRITFVVKQGNVFDEKKEIVKEFELGLYDEIKLSYEGGVISIKEIEHGYY